MNGLLLTYKETDQDKPDPSDKLKFTIDRYIMKNILVADYLSLDVTGQKAAIHKLFFLHGGKYA